MDREDASFHLGEDNMLVKHKFVNRRKAHCSCFYTLCLVAELFVREQALLNIATKISLQF